MARHALLFSLLFLMLLPLAPNADGQQETYITAPAQVGSTRYVEGHSVSPDIISGMMCGQDAGCNDQTSCTDYFGGRKCRTRCYYTGCNCWIVYCSIQWPMTCNGRPCTMIEMCPGEASSGPFCNTSTTTLRSCTTETGICESPVIIDVDGDGIRLTDIDGGVSFDIDADGNTERVAWTETGSDDAWLILDRNANGRVDGAAELFGNHSPQPASESQHGYIALGTFDSDRNGVIDAGDPIWRQLRVWRDGNHDGESQANELATLESVKITGLEWSSFHESARKDRHGNSFRYRAKVIGTPRAAGRWSYDVFLGTRE
jgi:hypothetical protein